MVVQDIQASLRELVDLGGSDLHLKVGAPPRFRIDGVLQDAPGAAVLETDDTEAALLALLPEPSRREEFAAENEVDFSFDIPGSGRFRVNAFRQRGTTALVCRAIPHHIRSIEDLYLPEAVRTLAEEERGIVLLAGATGSGKSTTLAAMIDHINETRSRHIVTIEDPIEFVHQDKCSAISQREIGTDTASFARALRRVLRQDPDVILIGEMRDEETVRTALSAAETGHLVFSTIHAVDATESINRMLEFFPPHQHHQVRSMVAGTVRGVISQRLIPGAQGGRVAACEVMLMTGRARDMVLESNENGSLAEVIADGGYYGMQTFEQALLKHLHAGLVNLDDALAAATNVHDFKLLVQADGRRGTTMADLADKEGDEAPTVHAESTENSFQRAA
jgi:twitching motility protein PilT